VQVGLSIKGAEYDTVFKSKKAFPALEINLYEIICTDHCPNLHCGCSGTVYFDGNLSATERDKN